VVGSDAWLARVEDSVVVLVNEARRRHRLPALRTDERLRTAARAHSADMRDRSYLAHDAPDGRSPDDRMRAAGYRQPASENIAVGYPTPHAVLQAWLRSPGHRANIVDPRFRAIGVGVARGDGGPWWTQDLGHE
jgi:uncharacterized protein YkwD